MAKKRPSTEDLNKDLNQKQSKKISDEEYLSKLGPTYDELNDLLKANEDNDYNSPLKPDEKKEIIEQELKKAIHQDDFNKAFAILNYASSAMNIYLNKLDLGNFEDESSIGHIALERDRVEEFTNLLLVGENSGYLGTE